MRRRRLLVDRVPVPAAPGIRVRAVPLEALADSITDETWLVVFSLVQSATGVSPTCAAILEAAARHGALTFCDVTQAAGVLPVDASLFDVTVCHTYKWLCSPRGVSFLTIGERFDALLTPAAGRLVRGRRRLAELLRPRHAPRARRAPLRRLARLAGLDRGRAVDRAVRRPRHRRGLGPLRRPRRPRSATSSASRSSARRS